MHSGVRHSPELSELLWGGCLSEWISLLRMPMVVTTAARTAAIRPRDKACFLLNHLRATTGSASWSLPAKPSGAGSCPAEAPRVSGDWLSKELDRSRDGRGIVQGREGGLPRCPDPHPLTVLQP